ncbi:hypothetical protein [Priestia megaterium]|uniref:hypothetical protein n=1 Tax=Priestia megaterium TaxID=1404 RepID=UPI003CC5254E
MVFIKITNSVAGLTEAGYNLQDGTGEGMIALSDRLVELFPEGDPRWDYSYSDELLRIILFSGNYQDEEVRTKCAEFGTVISISDYIW